MPLKLRQRLEQLRNDNARASTYLHRACSPPLREGCRRRGGDGRWTQLKRRASDLGSLRNGSVLTSCSGPGRCAQSARIMRPAHRHPVDACGWAGMSDRCGCRVRRQRSCWVMACVSGRSTASRITPDRAGTQALAHCDIDGAHRDDVHVIPMRACVPGRCWRRAHVGNFGKPRRPRWGVAHDHLAAIWGCGDRQRRQHRCRHHHCN